MILRVMRESMVDDGVGQLVEFLGGLKTSGVFVHLLGYSGTLLSTSPNSHCQPPPAFAPSVQEILHLFERSPGL